MKKALLFSLILGLAAANFILVKPAHAVSVHDHPWCNWFFWEDDYCSPKRDEDPAPAAAPTPAPTSTNQAPVWASGQTGFNIKTGDNLQFTINAFDPDSDPITYGVSFLPMGASFDSAAKIFSWIPSTNQAGTYLVQFSAYDGKAYSYLSITITVTENTSTNNPANENNQPNFGNFDPPGHGKVGEFYHYDVNAYDLDNDILTYNLLSAPTGMVISVNTGLITWTPSNLQTGWNYIKVSVSDGKGQISQDFYIFVDGPNVAPSPTPQPPINPNPKPVPEQKIKFSNIKFENNDGEISVSWTTNIPSSSRIIYDTTSEADRTKNFSYAKATPDDRDLVTDHKVNMGKLEIGTVYYLRLVSKTENQVAVSNEIVFIVLENGKVNSLFGASLFSILGPLFKNATFLWLIIIGLAVFLFFLYRKIQKANSPL